LLENLPKLSQELRALEKAPHRLSTSMAVTLKVAVMGIKKVNLYELLTAADAAIEELDRIVRAGKASAQEVDDRADLADSAKDARTQAVDLSPQASRDDALQTRLRNPLMRLWPRGSE
jgi:hypothetical protein